MDGKMNQWDEFLSELDREARELLESPVEDINEAIYHHFGYDYNPFDPLLPLRNPNMYLPHESLFKWFVKNLLLQLRRHVRSDDQNMSLEPPENYLVVGATGQGKSTFLLMMALALAQLESLKKIGNVTMVMLPFRAWRNVHDSSISEIKKLISSQATTIHVATSPKELEDIVVQHEDITAVWLLFMDDAHLLAQPESSVPPVNALISQFFKPVFSVGAIPLGVYLYMHDFRAHLRKDSSPPRFRTFTSYFKGRNVLLPPLDVNQMESLLKIRFTSNIVLKKVLSEEALSFVADISFGNPRLALDILFRAFIIARRLERDVVTLDAMEAGLHQLGITNIHELQLLLKDVHQENTSLKPLLGKRTLLIELLLYNNYLMECSTEEQMQEQWGRHLARMLGISPSTLSYHLKTLTEFSDQFFPLVKEKVDPRDHRAKIVTINDNLLPLVEALLLGLKKHEKKGSSIFTASKESPVILPPISSTRIVD